MKLCHCVLSFTLSLPCAATFAADRDIQIRTVNFESSVVELHNFGNSPVSMDGWRFCTQDDNETLRYSGTTGLNGKSLASGESFYIHYLNDAIVASNRVNLSSLGGSFALPLDRGPYALSLYNGGSFGNGANMIDHVQWNTNGVDNATADERSDEAVTGGLWIDETKWVHTTQNSRLIELADYSGSEMHDYMDYTTVEGDVVFWFRFNEAGGTNHFDSAQRFGTASAFVNETRTWRPSWSDPIYDHDHDVANPYAFSGPISLFPVNLEHDPLPVTTNWTAEAIHQFNSGGTFTTFFDLDEENGVISTNSRITMRWIQNSGTGKVDVLIRDRELKDTSETTLLVAHVPEDGTWHHVAAVKQGTVLYGYLDYVLVASNDISFRGDGTYEFTAENSMSVGISLNNANASKAENVLDEIRLTQRALDPTEFIQPSQPQITDYWLTPGPFVNLSILTTPGQDYLVQKSTNGVDGPWETTVSFPNPSGWQAHAGFTVTPPADNISVRVLRD